MDIETSTIFIVNDVIFFSDDLVKKLPLHSSRIILNDQSNGENFKKEDAVKVIKEAYISTSTTKYIILASNKFEISAQNAMLKILEEPPKNIIFIIVSNSKVSLLPTIFSRMSYKYLKTNDKTYDYDIDILNLDLNYIYKIIKEKNRIDKIELKNLIELILYKFKSSNIRLDEKQLNSISMAIKLNNFNAKPINILTTLLLNLSNRVAR